MESIHDPIKNSEVVEYRPEISENSFLIRSVFNQKGDLLRKDKLNSRGNVEESETLKYDERNNKIESTVYHIRDVLSKRVSKFNDWNKLIEINEFDSYGKRIGKQISWFDATGKRIDQVLTLFGGVLVITSESVFDEREHNIENYYFSDETLTSKEINRYDSQGNRIETIQYYPFKKVERITHFKYDSLHNNIETIVLNGSLMIESRAIMKYDEKHNVVERFTYGIKGNLKEHVQHKYEYNEVGHWTKDITFINKKPISVTLRVLEYY